MRLSEEEKQELRSLTASSSLRDDADALRSHAKEEVLVNGEVDPLRYMQFLTNCNAFLNHPMKERRPFIERIMKL